MKTLNFVASACRYCRFYKTEGRRGGLCQQLGVPVRGTWKSCSLALPPFAPSWENLEESVIWMEETLKVPDTLPANCSIECSQTDTSQEAIAPHYRKLTTKTLV